MNKYIITVLILVICNLVALLVYNCPDAGKILSIISTAISIALGLVAICLSIVYNNNASNSLASVDKKLVEIKMQTDVLYEERVKVNSLFEQMVRLNENAKSGTINNNDKEAKQKEIDAEFNNIRKSFENYNRTANIFKI